MPCHGSDGGRVRGGRASRARTAPREQPPDGGGAESQRQHLAQVHHRPCARACQHITAHMQHDDDSLAPLESAIRCSHANPAMC